MIPYDIAKNEVEQSIIEDLNKSGTSDVMMAYCHNAEPEEIKSFKLLFCRMLCRGYLVQLTQDDEIGSGWGDIIRLKPLKTHDKTQLC